MELAYHADSSYTAEIAFLSNEQWEEEVGTFVRGAIVIRANERPIRLAVCALPLLVK
jgi:hypothetical protein